MNEEINAAFLQALALSRTYSTEAQHVVVPETYCQTAICLQEWQDAGSPHQWVLVQRGGLYTAWVDVAYGAVAIFSENKFTSGKFMCHLDDVVCLDKDYYCLDTYLFSPFNKEPLEQL